MIYLTSALKLSSSQALQYFDELFSFQRPELMADGNNIHNFLTTTYREALRQFASKLDVLDYIDEEIFFVFDKAHQLVGYACFYNNRWSPDPGEYEMGIFIKGSERGKGYGSLAIQELEKKVLQRYPEAKKLILSPKIENEGAARLYERLGYEYDLSSIALSYGFFSLSKEI